MLSINRDNNLSDLTKIIVCISKEVLFVVSLSLFAFFSGLTLVRFLEVLILTNYLFEVLI